MHNQIGVYDVSLTPAGKEWISLVPGGSEYNNISTHAALSSSSSASRQEEAEADTKSRNGTTGETELRVEEDGKDEIVKSGEILEEVRERGVIVSHQCLFLVLKRRNGLIANMSHRPSTFQISAFTTIRTCSACKGVEDTGWER